MYKIYFIQCGKGRTPIKIGYAKNVERRLSELQIACPFTLRITKTINATSKKHAEYLEKWFHDRFQHKRIRGEWFTYIATSKIENCIEYALSGIDWDDTVASTRQKHRNKLNRELKDGENKTDIVTRVDKKAGRMAKNIEHKRLS